MPAETIEDERASLYEAVWRAPLTTVAAGLNITPNGLAKMCDRLGVPRPSRDHWRMSEQERLAARPPLPEVEAPAADGSRRKPRRVRMSMEDRQAQLLDIATEIVRTEGTEAISLNRLAREAGISEAQAHNCFSRRVDVLAELARREVEHFEKSRRGVVLRGQDRLTRIIMSTTNYLIVADRRGAMIQALLLEPEVREILRGEHETARQLTTEPIVQSMGELHDMAREEAVASNWLVTALCLRTGGLISNGSLPLESAMRICLPMVMGCVRSNAGLRKASRAAAAGA
ncbi:MAG: TetR/AcrR family transcriptional regulator [Erythrobacter sp.]|nr:TetR/AcrR family transcriptional regulator [Erythrobacter sp.]